MLSLRLILSLAFMIASVTSLQCYSNEHWFVEGINSRMSTYQPQPGLRAVVCDSGVNHCVQSKQKGDEAFHQFGSSEVLSFSCDIYSECYDGDGKK